MSTKMNDMVQLAIIWLSKNDPNVKVFDMSYLRGNRCPDYLLYYIENKWEKISDEGGGTYQKPGVAQDWLAINYPNMKIMNMNVNAAIHGYPRYVSNYIKNKWEKISDEDGGTYKKPSN